MNKYKLNDWLNTPFVTYFFLAVSILVYIAMEFFLGGSQNIYVLIRYGAKVNELIKLGAWWRVITPIFIHIGFSHLVMNGLALYYLGRQLEQIIGHSRFFILYLGAGITGNIFSFALSEAVSAGASTAIFGMFAAVYALGAILPRRPYVQMLARQYKTLIIINIAFSLVGSGIDIAGHVGGALGGYLLMKLLSVPEAGDRQYGPSMSSGLAYLTVTLLFYVIGMKIGPFF